MMVQGFSFFLWLTMIADIRIVGGFLRSEQLIEREAAGNVLKRVFVVLKKINYLCTANSESMTTLYRSTYRIRNVLFTYWSTRGSTL